MGSSGTDSTRFGLTARWLWLRRRSAIVDHVSRALIRYDRENGSRLAAAIAYYGFFATFALGVLLFAILGQASARTRTESTAKGYIENNLPLPDAHTLVDASKQISVLAIGALILAGIWWVEALRSSQRALWCVEQHPGHLLVRYLIDLGVLATLGLLLAVSLGISLGLQDLLRWLVGDRDRPIAGPAVGAISALLPVAVDFILAAALLAVVPRLRIPPRRLLPAALLIVCGLALLKTGGRWYVDRITLNPAYQLVAGTIGLLLFMYLFNQIVLLATALAATGTRGTVRDVARGLPGRPVEGPAPTDAPPDRVMPADPHPGHPEPGHPEPGHPEPGRPDPGHPHAGPHPVAQATSVVARDNGAVSRPPPAPNSAG